MTSGASDTIFMKRSRSSGVTGPKMQVPMGPSMASMSAAALAADREARAHDDGVVHFALLDLAARNRVLDRDLDDVADVRVAAMRGARDADHLHHARAAVVGGDEVAFLLDHGRGLRRSLRRLR